MRGWSPAPRPRLPVWIEPPEPEKVEEILRQRGILPVGGGKPAQWISSRSVRESLIRIGLLATVQTVTMALLSKQRVFLSG